MKRLIQSALNRAGYFVEKRQQLPGGSVISNGFLRELSDDEREILYHVSPFTMTTAERIVAMIRATRYISQAQIPGAIVECGVYRGGSMMAAALALPDQIRDLYLLDTFEGMTAPTDKDRNMDGKLASEYRYEDVNCTASLDDVRSNMSLTHYPLEKLHFIKGKVEETIPMKGLSKIALLRLDTDWYESTKHELRYLFPLLSIGGVLIIDDYGHWRGTREAVDEYLEETGQTLLLQRVDYACYMAIKTC